MPAEINTAWVEQIISHREIWELVVYVWLEAVIGFGRSQVFEIDCQVSRFPLPGFTYSHGKWVQTSGFSFYCQIISERCVEEIQAEFCGEGRRRKGEELWKAVPYLTVSKWIAFIFCSTVPCLAQRQSALCCSMEKEIERKLYYKQGTICAVAS